MYGSSYYGGYGYTSSGDDGAIFAIIAAVIAFIFMIVAFICIIPAKKRDKLSGFLRVLHDIFNFNGLIIEVLLKAMYVFSTVFMILYSFLMIFTGVNIEIWIVSLLLSPIAIRLAFELTMMGILLVKNVISINSKLKYPEDTRKEQTQSYDYTQYNTANTQNNTYYSDPSQNAYNSTTQDQAYAYQNPGYYCPNCGNPLYGNETFCEKCGTPITYSK